MRILELIDQLDRDREKYVSELEAALQHERKRNAALTDLLVAATASNERKQLELILAGHFDRFRAPNEEQPDGDDKGQDRLSDP